MSFKNHNENNCSSSEGVLDIHLAAGEIILGTLDNLNDCGEPIVSYTIAGHSFSGVAQPTTAISSSHLGQQVALLFASADIHQPIIAGIVFSPLQHMLENYSENSQVTETEVFESATTSDQVVFDAPLSAPDKNTTPPQILNVDGKKVVIEGDDEVVLKCGDASITLTKAGKIMIRGKYVLNRSSGVNRILGGSVQVN